MWNSIHEWINSKEPRQRSIPASNTEYLQRLTKNLNTNSNVHVGYVAMHFETINTIVSHNAIAAVVSSIMTIDQSSSHARMFPKMFLRISERLTKSCMTASISMRFNRSWWMWQTATELSLSCVIVLRSHVLRRLKLLNERSASAEDAGHTRSRRMSATTEGNRSRTSFFNSRACVTAWVNDVRLTHLSMPMKHGQLRF